MSELAERARSKAKSKLEKLMRKSDGDVDASGWREPTDEKGTIQTGPRPISRRQFRRGGKVSGVSTKSHAGRKQRAGGGHLPDYSTARTGNLRRASDAGKSSPHGARFQGAIAQELTKRPPFTGRIRENYGMGQPNLDAEAAHVRMPKKSGGATTVDGGLINRDVKEANQARVGNKHIGGMRKGGRAHKMMGGAMSPQQRMGLGQPGCRKSGGAVGKKAGGSISAIDGTRPAGDRIARKGGGRAKKGMNVNIIIAPGQSKPAMPPPGMLPPPGGGPVGMRQGMPPPPAAMPPAGAPPPAGPPPMMRKRGGKVGNLATGKLPSYPIKNGAGGALGRLEKARAYG